MIIIDNFSFLLMNNNLFLLSDVNWYLDRRAGTNNETDQGIYVKHFKNIPMADMELVLVSIPASGFAENRSPSTFLPFFFHI